MLTAKPVLDLAPTNVHHAKLVSEKRRAVKVMMPRWVVSTSTSVLNRVVSAQSESTAPTLKDHTHAKVAIQSVANATVHQDSTASIVFLVLSWEHHSLVKTLTSAPVEPCAWECTKSASTPQDTTSASAPASSSVTKPPDSASQIQPSTPSTFHHQLEELQKPRRKKPRKKKRLKKRRKNYKKETKPVVVFGLDF